MADKKKKFTKTTEEIVSLVDAKVRSLSSWSESKLSKERSEAQQFYNGTKPKRQHNGSSSYVSNDVYDSVEMMKAQLLETFATGHEIVRFDPVGPEDIEEARIATAYTAHMVFDRNDGFGMFGDTIHDGLMNRVGVVELEWEEDYTEEDEEFEEQPLDQVEAFVAQPDVETLESSLNEETGLYSGKLVRKRDCSKVNYEVVPSEEFLIEERAKSIDDSNVTSRRQLVTRADLVKAGYPKHKIDRLKFDDETTLDLTPDKQARDEDVDDSSTIGKDAIQDELQYVLLYKTYIKLALEEDGVARLYRIVHADKELFEGPDLVDRRPYKVFTPLPVPHKFYGNSFAARVMPHQTARTALVRSVLDHAAITNNPRLQVLKGGLLNPRELLDNRLGGLVNVNRPDAITPMQQTPLNPFIFEILKLIKDNREETTGISSLSQGLNKDAISKQNSTDLIDKMVSISQQRQKIIARNFGKFVKEIWLETYRLIIDNETKERIFEYAGNYVQVNPTSWIERRNVTVSLHLGYGEQDKEANKYVNTYKALSSDPVIGPLFSIKKRHKLISDTLIKNGIRNVDDYLERPESVEPPGPDPIKMKELEIKDKQAQAAIASAQASQAKVQADSKEAILKLEIEKLKLQIQAQKNERDAIRQDADTANRIDVSQREIELAEQVPPEGQRGIFSPNS